MPAITYSEWGGGLDRRLPLGVQDANRLWTLRNAYVTAGRKIRKRPGLRLVNSGLSGSVGLAGMNGGLQVFVSAGSPFSAPAGVGLFQLTPYSLGGPSTLVDVLWAKMFQGFPYVVAVHETLASRPPSPPGQVSIPGLVLRRMPRHHYIDGSPSTLITDVNCPHGSACTVAASRVFTTGQDVVRYCAAGAARDWTTANDAGFLGVSLQQETSRDPTAVGTFEDALVVLFEDGSQVWDVAVDPASNQLRRRISGMGTKHPQSLASFSRDLVFAAPYGVRSMAVQEGVDRFDENDVGVPIDSVVLPTQAAHEAIPNARPVRGVWVPQLGQYWLIYDTGASSTVYAYSFSRSSKVAAWSEYTFPIVITGVATLDGRVYVRSASSLYELDDDLATDDGVPIQVDVQMAFQDAKSPGVEKMFWGADFVFSGTAQVSYLYDPRDIAKETIAQSVTGDNRAGSIVPVEVVAPAIAPRFRHAADEPFSLDLATLYFDTLSVR